MSGRCIPCEEAEARNAKVQAADVAGRAYMRKHKINSMIVVEVLRDGCDFTAGEFTFCAVNDPRLQTIFHEVNTLIR